MLVLTITGTGFTTEIHMLNPGETFERFGGSSQGLTVRKTASIITRSRSTGGGVEDVERDITQPAFWKWIAERINGTGCTADVPEKHSVFVKIDIDAGEKSILVYAQSTDPDEDLGDDGEDHEFELSRSGYAKAEKLAAKIAKRRGCDYGANYTAEELRRSGWIR